MTLWKRSFVVFAILPKVITMLEFPVLDIVCWEWFVGGRITMFKEWLMAFLFSAFYSCQDRWTELDVLNRNALETGLYPKWGVENCLCITDLLKIHYQVSLRQPYPKGLHLKHQNFGLRCWTTIWKKKILKFIVRTRLGGLRSPNRFAFLGGFAPWTPHPYFLWTWALWDIIHDT